MQPVEIHFRHPADLVIFKNRVATAGTDFAAVQRDMSGFVRGHARVVVDPERIRLTGVSEFFQQAARTVGDGKDVAIQVRIRISRGVGERRRSRDRWHPVHLRAGNSSQIAFISIRITGAVITISNKSPGLIRRAADLPRRRTGETDRLRALADRGDLAQVIVIASERNAVATRDGGDFSRSLAVTQRPERPFPAIRECQRKDISGETALAEHPVAPVGAIRLAEEHITASRTVADLHARRVRPCGQRHRLD